MGLGAIAQYTLLESLEPAGAGQRFRARDTRLGRTVDIRLMPPAFAADEATRSRVLEEVQQARALSQPNVVALFDAGEHEGSLYFVFELPRGGPVRREMGGRPLAPRRATEIGIQAAEALAAAHAHDIVHGALQLDSILITEKNQVKIVGFGLPTLRAFEAAKTTSPGEAREGDGRRRREAPDDRADIHALGAALYEMVTGRRPVASGTAKRPTVPRELNPESPPELDDVILRAMASRTSQYQTAVTMGAELRAVAAMLDVRETSAEEEAAPTIRIGKVFRLAALMIVVLGAIAWWVLRR